MNWKQRIYLLCLSLLIIGIISFFDIYHIERTFVWRFAITIFFFLVCIALMKLIWEANKLYDYLRDSEE